MVTTRVRWDDLNSAVLTAIETHTGPILDARPVSDGFNSELATVVHPRGGGAVFVKGLRVDHPRAWTQQVEATINPYVAGIVAPELLWRTRAAGWDLLGFTHLDGRHADYAPGSPDLPAVADTLRRLQDIPSPNLPLKRAEQRWEAYTDTPDLFAGDQVLHTDFNPHNVVITGQTAWLVDWAWPTYGAAWIDPACLATWLIAAGNTPAQAHAWASHISAYAAAPAQAVAAFAQANARLWGEIAADDPDPWTATVSTAATCWSRHYTR